MSRTFGTVGATDNILVANNATINNLNTFTICCWVYRTGPGGGGSYGRICDKNTGANTGAFAFNFDTDFGSGVLQFGTQRWTTTDGFWYTDPSIAPTPPLRMWTHVALSYDYTSVNNIPKIYINGMSVPVVTQIAPAGTLNTETTDLVIGNNTIAAGPNRNWAGNIEEFALWNIILKDDEIGAISRDQRLVQDVEISNLILYLPITGLKSPEVDSSLSGFSGTVTGTMLGPRHPFPVPILLQDIKTRTRFFATVLNSSIDDSFSMTDGFLGREPSLASFGENFG